jgi:hypothetical protein
MKWLERIVKSKKQHKLKPRALYACTAGKYIGNFYLNYETNPITLDTTFIILPDFNTATLSPSTVQLGLSSGVLDFVEVFKPTVFEHVVIEFEGRKRNETKPTKENNQSPNILSSGVAGDLGS